MRSLRIPMRKLRYSCMYDWTSCSDIFMPRPRITPFRPSTITSALNIGTTRTSQPPTNQVTQTRKTLDFMADPLSVSESEVGIVSLGITALEGLITYCSALTDQDDDIMSVNSQLRRLLQIFTAIKSRIDETKNPLPLEKRDDIKSTLKECYAEVKELYKKLQAIQTLDQPKGSRAKIKARFIRLLYPFDGKDTVLKIKEIAGGLNGHISAVMSVLQIDVALEMNTTIVNVQGNLKVNYLP
ncbi:hypothetical protein EX30DRAFT_49924 [Ascodesmis nigricans]|uniref:NACHT-NTPase and P-loop NTPases N-terminal domain-containing protein n=1 Tax=Ascodesmis nigricans TaxID=341454 RepID=A0A4S2MVW6_9PEZI|nr:hypothetical protein EX30DRAFT_49924 [Ascodesmis nigricans]